MIALYIWNYFLKKNVLEKTKEIEKTKKNINIILNNLNIALFIVSDSNIIIECNKAALTLLSKERKDIVGKNLFDLSEGETDVSFTDYHFCLI